MGHAGHVVPGGDHAFRKEEPDGQLPVVARRPHGHRQRLARRADLERLLDDHLVVGRRLRDPAGDAADLAPPDSFDHALHDSFIFSLPSSSTFAVKETPQ